MQWNKLSTGALARRIGLSKNYNQVKRCRSDIIAALQERRSYLSFLEGVQGKFNARRLRLDDLFATPNHLPSFFQLQYQYLNSCHGVKTKKPASRLVTYDFNTGKARYPRNDRVVEVRIGKHLGALRNFVQKVEYRDHINWDWRLTEAKHNWEDRSVDWDWYISTDPREVYTMSTGRTWTSCMEFSVDAAPSLNVAVASGVALMLFCRNDHVCGRLLLNPCASTKGNPVVFVERAHGAGPSHSDTVNLVKRILRPYKTTKFNVQTYGTDRGFFVNIGEGTFPWTSWEREGIAKIDRAWRSVKRVNQGARIADGL